MFTLGSEVSVDFLSEQFPDFEFKSFEAKDGLITCVTCYGPESNILAKWHQIQNVIAGIFNPSNSLAKWNIYLAFLSQDKFNIRSRYNIQNDKFCCRKLIIDEFMFSSDLDRIRNKLNEELLGTDLHKTERSAQTETDYISKLDYILGSVATGTGSSDRSSRNDAIASLMETLAK